MVLGHAMPASGPPALSPEVSTLSGYQLLCEPKLCVLASLLLGFAAYFAPRFRTEFAQLKQEIEKSSARVESTCPLLSHHLANCVSD